MELPPRYKLLTDPSSSFNIKRTGHLYEVESCNYRGYQPDHLEGVKRNLISTFSKDSRRRLIKAVSAYGIRCPIFGTTTYDDPMPSIAEAKRHNDRFMKRILRKFPTYWIVWRMEFQPKSGRPHFHYLIYSPEKTPFIPHQWFKKSWREVTGRDSLRPEVKGMRSHKGGLCYASKYLCKEDQEGFEKYKKFHPGSKIGRFWGIAGRKNIPEESKGMQLSREDYKWLLYEMAKDKAERSMKRNLRKEGNTWDQISALETQPEWDEHRLNLMRSYFRKNGMPTWTLSDEPNHIDRTVRQSKALNDPANIDFVFRYC